MNEQNSSPSIPAPLTQPLTQPVMPPVTPPDVPLLTADAVASTPQAISASESAPPAHSSEPNVATGAGSSSVSGDSKPSATFPTGLGAGSMYGNSSAHAGTSGLPNNTSSGSSVFSTLMLLVALVALILSGMLWQRLDRIQQELARQSTEALEISKEAKTVADTSETQSTELQARLSVAEVKLSEVSLQRSQLEELMLSVSRSRDDTLVMDIESGIRLAMQQAELTGNTQALVAALQAADKRIARAAQPRLNPIQRALARDMERVQTAAVVDVAAMALRLDELARLIDELPLRNAPPPSRRLPNKPTAGGGLPNGAVITVPATGGGSAPNPTSNVTAMNAGTLPAASSQAAVPSVAADNNGEPPFDPLTGGVPETVTVLPPAAVESSTDATSPPPSATPTRKKIKPPTPTADAPPVDDTWVGKVQTQWRKFWERVVQDVSAGSRDLVRVSRIDEPDAMLLAPEQSFFLRENLKLKLLNARLSLLSRQVPSARADLMAARAALQKYFDPQAINTRQAVQLLADVLQGTKTVVMPRPDETLAALAKAAGGR